MENKIENWEKKLLDRKYDFEIKDVIGVLKTLGYNPEEIVFGVNSLVKNPAISPKVETSDVVSYAILAISRKFYNVTVEPEKQQKTKKRGSRG